MEATAGALVTAADIRLLKVKACELLAKKRSSHLEALSGRQFVSHSSLKLAKKPIFNIWSLTSKKCPFLLT